MKIRMLLAFLCLAMLLGQTTLISRAEDEEQRTIKLDKRLRYENLSVAMSGLTDKLLTPPIKWGEAKDEVHKRLGMPKEVIGFGTESYRLKDATVTVSYTTDKEGNVIANTVELRPKKGLPLDSLFNSSVELPAPPEPTGKKKKQLVRLTIQIRVEDIGNNHSLQITLIGTDKTASFISWGLVL